MRTLIVATAIAAPLAALVLALTGHGLLAATVFLLGGAVVMTPVLRPNVQWLGPVITHFETDAREVWLTIDDGPTADTRELLDLLDRHGVRVTFFVKGMLADPGVIREITARGHTIGNHSHTHPAGFFWCLPPGAIAREIDRCAAAIPPTPLFRAPVGWKNPFVHPLLARRNMHLVGFSARAFDAVRSNPEKIAKAIGTRLEPGVIAVLHQGRAWSLEAIEKTIELARARGYSFAIPSFDRLKTNR